MTRDGVKAISVSMQDDSPYASEWSVALAADETERGWSGTQASDQFDWSETQASDQFDWES